MERRDAMKKPGRRHALLRQRKLSLLLSAAAWLMLPEGALAQSCSLAAGTTCTTPYTGQVFSSSPLNTTIGATVTIVTAPTSSFLGAVEVIANGPFGDPSSSGSNAGNAAPVGTLTLQNNGVFTHTLPALLVTQNIAITLYGASIGGNGGNYTGDDGRHNAGTATDAQTATVTNTASITVQSDGASGTAGQLVAGAALLADSIGGKGGSAQNLGPDGNDNPTFGGALGMPGANGAAATLTNSGTVNANFNAPLVSLGYWGVAARSLGGDGGTGQDGTAGGAAGTATLTNTANVSVNMAWGTNAGGPAGFPPMHGTFAVHARSQGGNGSQSVQSGYDGGAGGAAGAVTMTIGNVSASGAVTPITIGLTTTNPTNRTDLPLSAAIGALSLGGTGAAGYDHSSGGAGGDGGPVTVSVLNGVTVNASGDKTLGILALTQGAIGGTNGLVQDNSAAGPGGNAGSRTATTPYVQVATLNTVVTTSGTLSPGIQAASVGGAGGGPNSPYGRAFQSTGNSSPGGAGGNVGIVQLLIQGGSITTTGAQSPGAVVIAQGGAGSAGADLNGLGGTTGAGGTGGQAAPVVLGITGGTVITTSGGQTSSLLTGNHPSFGVYAASIGGAGGDGGSLNVDFSGTKGNGGYGGGAYDVTLLLAQGVTVTTAGEGASAVVARSLGGAGGSASVDSAAGYTSSDGTGGAGGNSGNVSVTSGATINTSGQLAHGIVAQSIGGLGGDGANGAGVILDGAGNAGLPGNAGSVTVLQTGTILTGGVSAFGILAQSIGGGAGTAGSDSGSIIAVGGSAGAPAAGGAVAVTHSGSVTTQGRFAIGLLAQSIGGGGGTGGSADGVFRSVGGTGGGGGAGGTTTVTFNGGGINTLGGLAHGLVAQSIGGGGGNGGDAFAQSSSPIQLAIGGNAGQGGAGGAVVVNGSGSTIFTNGNNAQGLVAQSIGGGGGTGGSAYTLNGSIAITASVAIGGTGGTAAAGGPVTATLSGMTISTGQGVVGGLTPTNLNPTGAYGINLQSIGGGGGNGGSASAEAVTFGIPLPGTGGSSVAATATFAVGGTGAAGGDGGTVSLALNANSSVTTQGQGSHGLLLQSIGGGGGTGGDSSAMAATTAFGRAATAASTNDFSLELSLALGGSSTSAGSGGTVTATIDNTTITTLGDYANAVVLHSIGGGGGNGGVGSSTTLAFGSTRDINRSVGMGGTAGAGGNGGSVTISLSAQTVLQTYGASAMGVVAQSIGGGGGLGQGGTINLGSSYAVGSGPTVTPTATMTVNLGATGGAGGSGGTVTGNINGQVRTAGSDSAGVVLQSIGGGGGVAGSAGAEASSDNPILQGSKLRAVIDDFVEKNAGFSYTHSVTIGGGNGVSGAGGTVIHNQAGQIATLGDWSHGVVAQSISGGGGMGGAAASGTSSIGLNLTMGLGGSAPTGGTGGGVTLNFSQGSSISTGAVTSAGTTGYAAFGVLGQSIGGGGGIGADGSTGSQINMFLGGESNGSGLPFGDGGSVTVNGTASITTQGAVAAGMVLQSIGGGGGVGGSGNYLSIGTPTGAPYANISVGGLRGAVGNGGTVLVNNATLNIATSGAHAYGLLAQSIGGGGGFGFTGNNATSISNVVGAGTPEGVNVGNGGTVTLNLVAGGIRTSGLGAHAIIAQSIGGGGGIAGLPTGAGGIQTLAYGTYQGASNPSGAGANVSITSSTPITTTGDFAYGILAQSIGGGGGLQADGSQVLVGSTNSGQANPAVPSGPSGSVTIQQNAPITVSGNNSVGIFAQSVGVLQAAGAVNITVAAPVQGGAGAQGLAIWSDSTNTGSSIQVLASGSVSALSGTAIRSTAGDTVNAGQVAGSYALGGAGRFLNSGTLLAGPSLVASLLDNSGTVQIAAHVPHGVSTVSGDFTQRAGGQLLLDADFSNRRNDVMNVAGNANLAGTVRPLISSVLPNVELTFLNVAGTTTGSLTGAQTAVFGYTVNQKAGGFSVSANADFTPAGYGLSRNVAAVAGHMQAAWDAGGGPLGPLFALLGNTADLRGPGAYSASLNQISPNANFAPGARVTAGARTFANAALSCPQFEGTTAMLREGECVWATLTGRTAAQAGSDGLSSFRLNATTWQIGGQRALGGGWFLGGSLAYEASRLSTTEGLNNGRGQAGFGAVTTKYQTGPWLFSGAVFGGAGEFNGTRTITLPGFNSIARGSPTLANAGAMLRATYTIGREEIYLRPSLTASLIYAASSAYRESGAGVLNLQVSGASSTVGALTPALELGGRVNLADGTVLRLFTTAGVSLLSQGQWRQDSQLIAAPAGSGRFSSIVKTDQVVGRFAAGVQVFATDRLELRLQYEGEYSQNLTGHGGALTFAYRF
jgi:hypothetical protein